MLPLLTLSGGMGLVALATWLMRPILSLFGTFVTVDELRRTQLIDRLIVEKGRPSSFELSSETVPGFDFHLISLRQLVSKPHAPPGLVIVHKRQVAINPFNSYNQYELFVLAALPESTIIKLIRDSLDGDANQITVEFSEMPTASGSRRTPIVESPPGHPFDWQVGAVQSTLRLYNQTKRASVLVHGKSGSGKSTLPMFIAEAMKRTLNVNPLVRTGVSWTTPGGCVADLLQGASRSRPLIVVLDEFQVVVDHAVEKTERGERATSLAKDSQKLRSTLDMINRFDYVLLVATTTRPIEEFESDFVRDGRFTQKVAAK